jgi:hypothetical protein
MNDALSAAAAGEEGKVERREKWRVRAIGRVSISGRMTVRMMSMIA